MMMWQALALAWLGAIAGASRAPQTWQAYASPKDAGFSAPKIEAVRAFADENRAAAVVAVYRGRVIASWGAVHRPLMAHSVRKSLAGALYGIAAQEGTLSLSESLATMGIDDESSLTAAERRATFGDLIASRSGVYHAAAYADSSQERARPARGSHAPGTFWFYNNWDFNAAESIYERKTGEDLYAAFDRRIARAIGMDDFDPEDQLEVLEPSRSRYPAHTFRISARDLARFGLLYLQKGRWGTRQVVPAEWIRESFRKRSETGENTGYGYLWWIYEPGSLGPSYPLLDRMTVYVARGTGGQALFIVPEADLVVVVRGDTDNGRSVGGPAIWQIVERLLAAREGQPAANPAVVRMMAAPLLSNLPPPPDPVIVALSEAQRGRVIGEYRMEHGEVVRVFEYADRLFMTIPSQGEAELFAISPLRFVVKVDASVRIEFRTNAEGRVKDVEVTIGRDMMRATRIEHQHP